MYPDAINFEKVTRETLKEPKTSPGDHYMEDHIKLFEEKIGYYSQ